jgi:N-acetyltransferase
MTKLALAESGFGAYDHVPMATEMKVIPVTLKGRHVRLEPLTRRHASGLAKVGLDEELWKWIPTQVRTAEEMAAWVETALSEQERGVSLPFALVEKATRRIIGSTRYGNIDRVHHRLEIGWTWVAGAWQRSPVNTEAKFLLLLHAFETLGCIHSEDWRSPRRHLPQPHDYLERSTEAFGLLQHH